MSQFVNFFEKRGAEPPRPFHVLGLELRCYIHYNPLSSLNSHINTLLWLVEILLVEGKTILAIELHTVDVTSLESINLSTALGK